MGFFGTWPSRSETSTFLCHSPCQKLQGLSNKSTGQNKPHAKTRPPVPYTSSPFRGIGMASLSQNHLHIIGCVVVLRGGHTSLQAYKHARGPPHPPAAVLRKEHCLGSDQNFTRLYSDFRFWLTFSTIYPSGQSRIPLKFSDVCCHIFLRSKHPGHLVTVSFTDGE